MAQLHVKIGAEPSIALPSNKNCAIYFQTCAKRDQKGGGSMCIPVSWRQSVCACWEAGPEASSCDIQVYQGFRAAQVENLRHSQWSVWQFLLNCSLDKVYVWAAATIYWDEVFIPNSAILVLKPMRVLGSLTIFP